MLMEEVISLAKTRLNNEHQEIMREYNLSLVDMMRVVLASTSHFAQIYIGTLTDETESEN